MRKFLSPLLAACLLTACNNATSVKWVAPKNSDLTTNNLKGRVEKAEETSFTVDSLGVSKKDSLVDVDDFDAKGYQTKYSTRDSAGKIHTDQTLQHDSLGNFTEVRTLVDGKQTYRLLTELDKNGKYSGGKSYDSTEIQSGYFGGLAENEYGIVYAGKQYFMNGKLKSSWENKFDGPTFVSGNTKDSSGKVTYSSSTKVNDKGDPIETVETKTVPGKDSTTTEKTTYKYDSYDDAGNWTQRTSFNEKGKATNIVKRVITYYKD